MQEIPFEVFTACRLRDLTTLRMAVTSLRNHSRATRIVVATASQNFRSFDRALGKDVQLVDEDKLIPGMTLASIRGLPIPSFPRGAGWYFQQLLKYAWCFRNAQVQHYLIWDADTVMLKPLDFFDAEGRTLMTKSSEYHAPYFETFRTLFDVPAAYEFSFISQHQMIDKLRLQEMLHSIEARFPQSKNWAWAILEALPSEGRNLFSEYETYGHWLKHYYPESIHARELPWLREGTEVAGSALNAKKLEGLAKDYYFVAFEARTRPWNKVVARVLAALRQMQLPFARNTTATSRS